jgi:hypothetical protein
MPRFRTIPSRLLPLLALLAFAGCSGGGNGGSQEGDPATRPVGIKVGVVTGTVSQGEDEFRAAQALIRKYPGQIRHVTYPDNFMSEQETVIAQIVGLAADPDVKVIVVGQAIPGSCAAVRKIRETRKDVLFGFVEAHEDPRLVNETADLAVQSDQIRRGQTVIDLAHKLGARTFVHYTFPRHMSMELLAERRSVMEQECAKLGMKFVNQMAPDPMGEGGLPATQQFVLEDVPRRVTEYGAETAFFSTNCGMQDPLIQSVLNTKAYFPEQCCPSPTHGYVTALGISVPEDKAGDMEFINAQNRASIASHGLSGHFATWPVPLTMLSIQVLADLLMDTQTGEADFKDPATVQRYFEEAAKVPVQVARYDENAGNSYLLLLDSIVY